MLRRHSWRLGHEAACATAWALLLGLSGCGVAEGLLGGDKPSAHVTGVSLKDIGLRSITMLFDLKLDNPYSAPLPLVNVDYSLASKGKQFLSDAAQLQGTVPAKGSKTVSLPVTLTYLGLLEALKDVRPGAIVPYEATLGLSVDAPVVGKLRLPLKKEGELPVPAVPEVSVSQIKWDNVSLDHAGGRFTLNLVNRNRFPVELSKLAYALRLGGVEVANSAITTPTALPADGGAGAVEAPISLSPKGLGLAAFNMLLGEGAGYQLQGALDVKTPFGPMSLPIDTVGKTLFRR